MGHPSSAVAKTRNRGTNDDRGSGAAYRAVRAPSHAAACCASISSGSPARISAAARSPALRNTLATCSRASGNRDNTRSNSVRSRMKSGDSRDIGDRHRGVRRQLAGKLRRECQALVQPAREPGRRLAVANVNRGEIEAEERPAHRLQRFNDAGPLLEQDPAHVAFPLQYLGRQRRPHLGRQCALPCRQTASGEILNRSPICRFEQPNAIAKSICGRCGCWQQTQRRPLGRFAVIVSRRGPMTDRAAKSRHALRGLRSRTTVAADRLCCRRRARRRAPRTGR